MTMIRMPLAAAALGAAMFLASAAQAQRNAAAQAQPAPAPERTTAGYGDWTLRCGPRPTNAPAGTPERMCELVLSLQDGRGQTTAQFALGRVPGSRPMRLVMLVPANISIPTAPQLQPDAEQPETDPIALAWRACGTGGCIADAELADAVLARLRAREAPGRVVWRDAARRPQSLPFSFRGLGAALDAYAAAR